MLNFYRIYSVDSIIRIGIRDYSDWQSRAYVIYDICAYIHNVIDYSLLTNIELIFILLSFYMFWINNMQHVDYLSRNV